MGAQRPYPRGLGASTERAIGVSFPFPALERDRVIAPLRRARIDRRALRKEGIS
jgi:hypothetical protein